MRVSRTARASAALLAAAGVFFPALAQSPPTERRAVYFDLQKCAKLQKLALSDRTLESSGGTSLQQCRGPGGWSVVVVDDDPRSWLVLRKGDLSYPLEREMVSEFRLGNFPNVAGTRLMEWRVDQNGQPRAFIVRVSYLRADTPASGNQVRASTLMAYGLSSGVPQFLGHATDNAAIRTLADRAR